jgi:signal transduction histidine kinase
LFASLWWDRIAVRLLGLVLAVSVLPILTLGLLAIRSGRANLEREVALRNQEVAQWRAEKVESYVANAEENLRLIANTEDLDPATPERAEPSLRLFLTFMEDVKEVFLLDAQGRERLRLSEGSIYTPADLASRRGRPEFEIPARRRRFVGPVTTSAFSEPLITVAIPLQDLAQDRVIGVLGVEVNLKRLWDEVLSSKVGDTGYLYLVDQRGTLIAHPDFSLVLAQTDARQVPVVQRFLAGEGQPAAAPALVEYRNYQGRPVLGTFARSAALGWAVVVEQPVAEALAHVEQTKVETTVMLVNTLLVTTLLGVLAARGLTRPLEELRRGAALVGAGKLSHTISADGRDEIGDLARAFNRMTANLRRSFTGLRTLLDTSTRISSSLRLDEVLPAAAAETGRVIPGVTCWTLLVERPWGDQAAGQARLYRGPDGPPALVELAPGAHPVLARSLAQREAMRAPAGEVPGGEGTSGSALIVPLVAGQASIGAILLISREVDRDFDGEEVALCRTIANQVGIAVENARLYARLEETALENARLYRDLEAQMAALRRAQGQLLQSEKMASLGTLAAGVAHEINNPIAFVSSNLHTLEGYVAALARYVAAWEAARPQLGAGDRAGALGDLEALRADLDLDFIRADLTKLLAESREGIGRVKKIIQGLREFAHVAPDEIVEADLNAGLEQALTIAWNELKYKADVVREYGPLPPIRCYPGQLGQVFLNLLVNAAQAIPERGTIAVRTWAVNGHVCVEVADTGAGIPPEVLPRIFDPFFTTKPVGQGTGLGLSIAYGIVQKHGGRIEVESTLGKGSTFRVLVPLAPPPVASQAELGHA